MTQKKIIIICLVALSLSLAAYLVFSLKRVAVVKSPAGANESAQDNKSGGIDLKKLETGYKTQVKFIVNEYETLFGRTEKSAEDVAGLKNKLTELSVPTDLRNLHLDLVVAFSRMENYLREGNEEDKTASEEIMERAKSGYKWLTGTEN